MRVHSSDQSVTEVLAKELALLRPAVRGDRATVVALLHEDFVEFGASGRIWNRAQIADALARDPGDVTPEAEEMRAASTKMSSSSPIDPGGPTGSR